ncbi:zinc-ribbon domain-containing protein [Turicibacter sanguinis]|uniref:zinc-ribbon domain-containing protein n=2 Tax=Turicibacter sanguinis TaxID=154288 RepID=UPI0021D492FE|nr:zinc-ribbon domain-containing protein [Turicibacter sanguinis]MCU7196709.1 zinc-ribbon domain-containing protein [Turicibacter sanguinis]
MDKWIDLSELPTKEIKRDNQINKRIDWKNSIGCSMKFKYGDIEDVVYIKNLAGRKVTIYNPKYGEKTIDVGGLSKCSLGEYLKLHTSDYKLEVGILLSDNKRNITIIDRKTEMGNIERYDSARKKKRKIRKKDKYYKYHCNYDGYEGWILESNLLKGIGCALCSGKTVVEGKNDVFTTRPDLIDHFVNVEEAKQYSEKSHKRCIFKCKICGTEKEMRVADLSNKGFSCPRCNDGFSYPEKFVHSCLSQHGIEFIHQLTSANLTWVGKYRYDFYLPKEHWIIEVHGDQHYNLRNHFSRNNDIDEIENDEKKEALAKRNGINKYTIINASKSELEWMKENILSSDLNCTFDFSNTDWIKCEKDARESKVLEVCKMKKEHPMLTSNHISRKFGIERSVIVDYLKRGNKIGLCEYSAKKEMRKCASRNHPRKPLIVKNLDGVVLGHYPSAAALEKISEEEYGFKMHFSMTLARVNPNSKYFGKTYHEYIIEEDKTSELVLV